MIYQKRSGTGAREMEQGKTFPYSPLNKSRGQNDLQGDGMINQGENGTDVWEMEPGKTLDLQSLK